MTDIDGWKDGTYADDGEAWKYANAAVDIIDRMRASQKASKSESVLPMAEVGGNEVACDHNFNRVSDCQVKCDKCGEDYKA